ncbi:hypothetical protein F5Y19DRAFT_477599 [Xylariaceae sp. FL1651]|nr:hypothetical protein F5Y19DRAFT_477599 [Xylariaceae sp. FL1651]
MIIRPTSSLPKRCESWTSDTTYSSLSEVVDGKQTSTVPDDLNDLYGSREQPKAALRKRFSWLHPLVHLLPLAATVGIVQLSFRGVYWDDESRYDARWQNFLQFPAKLHEILIVGSLSAIVLHIFRRMLVGPYGIPLGLMVGAYQIGSAEYLISKSFVKPLRHSLFHRHYKMLFVALALGLAIFYSFLVGPASAGAIIPVLAWWNMANPFNNGLPLKCYINPNLGRSELYPLNLQASDIKADCLGADWDYQGCPGEGFNVLEVWAHTRHKESERYNVTEGQSYNPLMLSSFSGKALREIFTQLAYSKNSSTRAAITATLHSSVLALTDAFWHYVSNNDVGEVNNVKHPRFTIAKDTSTSIPLVQVQCSAVDYGFARQGNANEDPYLTFETGAINHFSDIESESYSQAKWFVPNEAWNFTRPWNAINITWVDPSEVKGTGGETLHASLAAVITVPRGWRTRFPNGTSVIGQGSITSPCVIDARWAAAEVRFDPEVNNVVGTSFTDWLNSANLTAGDARVDAVLSNWNVTGPIAIAPNWATTLNALYMTSDTDNYTSYFVESILKGSVDLDNGTRGEKYLEYSPNGVEWTLDNVSDDIAIVLSTVITDWLSRSTFRDTQFTTVTSGEQEGNVSTVDLLYQRSARTFGTEPISTFANQTCVVFTVQRYGWGYGLNSGTIWFSIIILLMHALLVLLYFGYSFVFWYRSTGWTSAAWGSIGELVALAVLSPSADELQNSGSGIHKSKTWMTRLRVREEGPDSNHLALIVGNRGGTIIPSENMLKIDKEYA